MLAGITRIENRFSVEAQLRSLEGLEQLEYAGDIRIAGSTRLETLKALSSLKHIGGTLSIQADHSLTDLDGLESLETVDTLDIFGNDRLASLDALQSLRNVRRIAIAENSALPKCEVDAFVARFQDTAEEIETRGNTGEGDCE